MCYYYFGEVKNMSFSDALICILLTTFASCYAWGMRGTVIGGEKGAMLPGAFIGLILAWFSGGAIRECFVIPTAAGLMGMTFGGIETYGETIGLVLHRGRADYRPVKGYSGLALKGALWFSICGGFIGMSMASMSYSCYKTRDFVIFCLLIPVIQKIGYTVFNTPYDKEKGIHPKSYYSLTRREEWGSNLTLLIAIMAMAIIRGDDFSVAMMSYGFIFGAVGWVVAMKGFVLSSLPLKNGNYLFGKLFHKGLIDGWKVMEFVLGAFGGLGLSLAFCTRFKYVEKYNESISIEGRRFIEYNESFAGFVPLITAVCVVAVLAINVYQFICDRKGKETDSFLWDRIERPLFNVVPMLLVLLGSAFAARIMTVFMLVFVCAMKCVFSRFARSKLLPLCIMISLTVCGGVLAGDIILGGYGPFATVVAGTVPYLLAEFFSRISKHSRKEKSAGEILFRTSFATVFPFMTVAAAVLLAVSYKIFVK